MEPKDIERRTLARFAQLNKRLFNEMEKEMIRVAGTELVDHLYSVLDDGATRWFYKSNPGLGFISSYRACLEGKHKDVDDLLYRIEYGSCA